MTFDEEIWKDVVGYEGLYMVSNLGRVYSIPRPSTKGGIKKQTNMNGYLRTMLKKNGIAFNAGVHRLVAQAFIPNPENKPTVNHIDGDKHNNCVDNLEWATDKEQLEHSFKCGLRKRQCIIQRGCKLISKSNSNNILYFDSCKALSEYLGFTKCWVGLQLIKHGNPFEYKDYIIFVNKRGDVNDVR